MNVEKFKIKIQKKLFWVLVLINDFWTWTTIAPKVANFVNYYVKDSIYKRILMKK
jgi:hypothetical protein